MKLKNVLLSLVAATLLSSCATTTNIVPVTGRKQHINANYSDSYILTLSEKSYREELGKMKESTNKTNYAMVKRVGSRIANAVETYLKNNGFAQDVKNFSWEFHLIQNNAVNAWCMPGGKIVVYEGLLPVTKNETCLAIVLGHEVAHAVARHSQENMTKSANTQMGANIASVIGSQVLGNTGSTLLNSALSIGGTALISGYSRKNETEADRMGLIFAAMAGYDPAEAVPFWQRMASLGNGSNSIFSDHPSDAQRISDIKNKFLPEAQKYYRGNAQTNSVTSKAATSKSVSLNQLINKKKKK